MAGRGKSSRSAMSSERSLLRSFHLLQSLTNARRSGKVIGFFQHRGNRYIGNSGVRGAASHDSRMQHERVDRALQVKSCQEEENCTPLPKTCARRDNICLNGTYLVPLEPRTLLTNS